VLNLADPTLILSWLGRLGRWPCHSEEDEPRTYIKMYAKHLPGRVRRPSAGLSSEVDKRHSGLLSFVLSLGSRCVSAHCCAIKLIVE